MQNSSMVQDGERPKGNKHLDFLITDPLDEQMFWKDYWTEGKLMISAVSNFQRYKIGKMNMQFTDFEQEFVKSDHEALEKLYQEPVEEETLYRIRERLSEGVYDLQEIFDASKRDVGSTVKRFIHKRRDF